MYTFFQTKLVDAESDRTLIPTFAMEQLRVTVAHQVVIVCKTRHALVGQKTVAMSMEQSNLCVQR